MTQRLFNRCVKVTIVKMAAVANAASFTNEAAIEVPALEITDLRVAFKIEKTSNEKPNTSEVQIYNLSEASRGELQTKPLQLQLFAGFDNSLELIFIGDVTFVSSQHNGVEWVTKIQVGDGDRAFNEARVPPKSYRKGVNAKTLVGDLAASMGLKVPGNLDDVKELVGQFASGAVLQGPSSAQMTKIAKARGLSWSVQNNQLQLLREGESLMDGSILADVISEDAGMIGSPDFGGPKKPGDPATLTISTMLWPRLLPGRALQVQAEAVQGLFHAVTVTHSGDTAGGDWVTKIEATPK